MADQHYLDEFVSGRAEGLHLRLLRVFASACRKPGFPESEYATILRRALDEALSEATNEATGPDNH